MSNDQWEELREQLKRAGGVLSESLREQIRRAGDAIPEDLRNQLRDLAVVDKPKDPEADVRAYLRSKKLGETTEEKIARVTHGGYPPPNRGSGVPVRETIINSIRELQEGQSGPPRGPLPPDIQALADKAVLTIFEMLALLFGLPFGEDLYHGTSITGWHYFYLVIAILFAGSGPMWPLIRTWQWVPKGATASISRAAADARVWLAILLLLFVYGVGPELYRRATNPVALTGAIGVMPIGTSCWDGKEPPCNPKSPPPATSLRIQFNATGKPQEIEAKNIQWTWANPEKAKLEVPQNELCKPGILGSGSNSILCAPQLITTDQWIIFLVFPQPIAATEIKVNSHGASLPAWHTYALTDRKAYLWFEGDLKNMVLDIEVIKQK